MTQPVIAEISGEELEVVGGPARVQLGQLQGRAALRFRHWHDGTPDRVLASWVVRGEAGSSLDVVARHERAGQSVTSVTLTPQV